MRAYVLFLSDTFGRGRSGHRCIPGLEDIIELLSHCLQLHGHLDRYGPLHNVCAMITSAIC